MALCLSIFLEAIQRFVEPQTVTNPKLVLIVGCFGLLSNILGLLLFHEHGHSHGGGGHGHAHGADSEAAITEEGHSHTPLSSDPRTSEMADESGNVADVLPQNAIGGWPRSISATTPTKVGHDSQQKPDPQDFSKTDEDVSTAKDSLSPVSTMKSANNLNPRRHRRRTSGSRSRLASVDDIHVHPASFRNEIIAASRLEDIESGTGTESENEEAVDEEDEEATEESHLLGKGNGLTKHKSAGSHSHKPKQQERHDSWHLSHNHNQPKKTSGGHSHGDLNMRGVFLHVMGDALGNIGVIASALIIWLSNYSWRFYSDPAISLIITIIILGSAIPLCKAASRILLQAVPAGISIDEIKEDIEELPGIVSCHHLHVWQLSDTKLVASLHVQVQFDFKGEGSARYMQLAKAVRHCLHEYGIHSSTIQPEFCLDSEHRHTSGGGSDQEGSQSGNNVNGKPGVKSTSKHGSRAASMRSEPDACLLDCGDECVEGSQCCTPSANDADGHDQHKNT